MLRRCFAHIDHPAAADGDQALDSAFGAADVQSDYVLAGVALHEVSLDGKVDALIYALPPVLRGSAPGDHQQPQTTQFDLSQDRWYGLYRGITNDQADWNRDAARSAGGTELRHRSHHLWNSSLAAITAALRKSSGSSTSTQGSPAMSSDPIRRSRATRSMALSYQ